MSTDKKSPDKEAQAQIQERQDLKNRIQNLEWSLARKNREVKQLQSDIEYCKQEVADLTAENDELKGASGSKDSDVG